MKLPTRKQVLLASLPASYLIAVVVLVLGCKPTNIGELLGSILLSSVVSIYYCPFIWFYMVIAAALLYLPIAAAIKIYQILTGQVKPEEPAPKKKRKNKTADASDPETNPCALGPCGPGSQGSDNPNTDGKSTTVSANPAVPEVPKLPEIQ